MEDANIEIHFSVLFKQRKFLQNQFEIVKKQKNLQFMVICVKKCLGSQELLRKAEEKLPKVKTFLQNSAHRNIFEGFMKDVEGSPTEIKFENLFILFRDFDHFSIEFDEEEKKIGNKVTVTPSNTSKRKSERVPNFNMQEEEKNLGNPNNEFIESLLGENEKTVKELKDEIKKKDQIIFTLEAELTSLKKQSKIDLENEIRKHTTNYDLLAQKENEEKKELIFNLKKTNENLHDLLIEKSHELQDIADKNKILNKILAQKELEERKTEKDLENVQQLKTERKTSLTIKKTTEQEHIIIDIKDLEIIREIGSGSFGTICLAQHKQMRSQLFAIKTVSTEKKSKEEIEQEINFWKTFQNENKPKSLPNFYSSSKKELESQTRKIVEYHLIFDYYQNSLKKVIDNLIKSQETENFAPFPLKKIMKFAKSLIYTLAYLQTFNVCHRDLKPDNMLVDNLCENIFVIDFGESRHLENWNTMILQTMVAGTVRYLSPEIYKIYKSADQPLKTLENINFFKSDVFGLGLVLLELGVLDLPKRNEKYEANIEKLIVKFEKTYHKIAIDEHLEMELEILVDILRICLQVKRKKRIDFIELFSKIMRNNNVDKIREIILFCDNDSEKRKKETRIE